MPRNPENTARREALSDRIHKTREEYLGSYDQNTPKRNTQLRGQIDADSAALLAVGTRKKG